jgi:hypothetical protein
VGRIGPDDVRIQLSDSNASAELLAELTRVGCVARETAPGTIDVVSAGEPSVDLEFEQPPDQDEMELLFFVRAWLLRHPGVHVRLLT